MMLSYIYSPFLEALSSGDLSFPTLSIDINNETN